MRKPMKGTLRSWILLSLSCVMMGSLVAGGAAGQETRPVFQIVAETYPPFEFERDGKVVGIDVDVTAIIMERLGVPYTFRVDYPFTRVALMLRAGKADAAPSISFQPERQSFLYYTDEQMAFATTGKAPPDYLWMTEYALFINRRYEASLRYESYEQLEKANYRVGLIKEYTYEPAFRALKLNTREYISISESFEAVNRGEIDVCPVDKTVGDWTLREMGLQDKLTRLPNALFTKPYLMVFSKASSYPGIQDLMTRYYAELRKMRENGEYRRIYESYVPPSSPWGITRPVTFVCEEWSPFEYMNNGVPAGIDVDVVDRIMKRLGIPYEVKIYPWSRAWMLAENGHADAVLSVSYNPSREDVLLYTEEQRAFAKTGKLPPDYLWMSEYVFFLKKMNAERFRFDSYAQMKRDGYRIGTNKDYSYCAEFVDAGFESREYPTACSGLRALVAGEIDLYPMDRTVGLAELDKMGMTDSVIFLPKPLFSKPYLVSFSRRSALPGLRGVMEAFYAELRAMRASGEYDEILRRYRLRPPDGE